MYFKSFIIYISLYDLYIHIHIYTFLVFCIYFLFFTRISSVLNSFYQGRRQQGRHDPPLFCVAKRKKENQRKKTESLKAETIKRLSPRSKCYYFSHSRASAILEHLEFNFFFLSANHGDWQYLSMSLSLWNTFRRPCLCLFVNLYLFCQE